MNGLLKSSRLFVKRNASTILTVVGGAGVVTTTVFAIKATPKALLLLDDAEKEKGKELTNIEKIKVAAPVYIPTIITGVTTLTCIFGANILNKRQQASLVSAYALLENSYKEFKDKVNELYGEDANDRIKEELAKDKYEKTEVKNDELLFYDDYSGQFFKTSLTKLSRAEYNVNRNIHTRGWAELNEFYEDLGIDDFEKYKALGWAEGGNYEMYWQAWVDFDHKKVTMEDGTEYTVLSMQQEPYVDYEEY